MIWALESNRASSQRPAANSIVGQWRSNAGRLLAADIGMHCEIPGRSDRRGCSGILNDKDDPGTEARRHGHVTDELDGISQSFIRGDQECLVFEAFVSEPHRLAGTSDRPRRNLPTCFAACPAGLEIPQQQMKMGYSQICQGVALISGLQAARMSRRLRRMRRSLVSAAALFRSASLKFERSASARSNHGNASPSLPRERSTMPSLSQMSALSGSSVCACRQSFSASSKRFKPCSKAARICSVANMVWPQPVAQVQTCTAPPRCGRDGEEEYRIDVPRPSVAD